MRNPKDIRVRRSTRLSPICRRVAGVSPKLERPPTFSQKKVSFADLTEGSPREMPPAPPIERVVHDGRSPKTTRFSDAQSLVSAVRRLESALIHGPKYLGRERLVVAEDAHLTDPQARLDAALAFEQQVADEIRERMKFDELVAATAPVTFSRDVTIEFSRDSSRSSLASRPSLPVKGLSSDDLLCGRERAHTGNSPRGLAAPSA